MQGGSIGSFLVHVCAMIKKHSIQNKFKVSWVHWLIYCFWNTSVPGRRRKTSRRGRAEEGWKKVGGREGGWRISGQRDKNIGGVEERWKEGRWALEGGGRNLEGGGMKVEGWERKVEENAWNDGRIMGRQCVENIPKLPANTYQNLTGNINNDKHTLSYTTISSRPVLHAMCRGGSAVLGFCSYSESSLLQSLLLSNISTT